MAQKYDIEHLDLLPAYAQGDFHPETPPAVWGPVRKRLAIAERHARGDVLEIGSGTGWLSVHLEAWGRHVVSTDLSSEARDIFASNAAVAGSSLTVTSEDVTSLSFASGTFDSVVCFSVLEHVPDVGQAVSEIRRVIRPGGIAVLGIPNGWGAYSLLNDRQPKRGFRVRPVTSIRHHHEHVHGPAWWRGVLVGAGFRITEEIGLEVATPLFARLGGYVRTASLSRWDARAADFAPVGMASDVIFVVTNS
jgi:SAM-dependent methyltransferase